MNHINANKVKSTELILRTTVLLFKYNSSEDLPYKFNGKEMDEETGLYYYGARYMNPVASIWYGVDPLAEKNIDVSGYVYCHNNPIVMIDPNGEDDIFNSKGQFVKTTAKGDRVLIQTAKGNRTLSSFNYSSNKDNFAQGQADYAVLKFNRAVDKGLLIQSTKKSYLEKLNDAFLGYASFSLTKNGRLSVTMSISEVQVVGNSSRKEK